VGPDSMVRTTLNNFTKPWGPFVRGIVARETMPTWERLWDDFVQEETRLISEASGQQRTLQGVKTLLFGQRARRRLTGEVDKVPSLGPRHRERAVVGRREI
jgi:hypothetical protein